MTQLTLAELSGVSPRAIADFEVENRKPIKATLAALQRALETAGVEFTNGGKPGVSLSKRMKRHK